jgi:hypothetical protein
MRILLVLCFCLLAMNNIAAKEEHPIKLNVQFDLLQPKPPFDDKPIHVNKVMKLDRFQQDYSVVMTETRVVNKFPVTLTLLVKPMDVTDKQMMAKFLLVQYGFIKQNSVISEPRLVFLKNQSAEIKYDKNLRVKVKGKWA